MHQHRHRVILLVGPPGSGKGTQGKILGRVPGFTHLSMGDVFRALDRESELGQIFRTSSERGELVPDEITIEIWRNFLRKQEERGEYKKGDDILLLDGIPRNANQATLLDNDLDVLSVINLTCMDPQQMVARLQGRARKEGRADDVDVDVIRRRLEIYQAETSPILDHYPGELVAEIDALGTPAEVLLRVLDVVAPIQSSHIGNVLETG